MSRPPPPSSPSSTPTAAKKAKSSSTSEANEEKAHSSVDGTYWWPPVEPDLHGFVLSGSSNGGLFLSHLPMFYHNPHQYQVLLIGQLDPTGQAVYDKARAENPQGVFILGNQEADKMTLDSIGDGTRRQFLYDLFLGLPQDPPDPLYTGPQAVLRIVRTVVLEHFPPLEEQPHLSYPPRARYYLFGSVDSTASHCELFIDHFYRRALNFQHVTPIKVSPDSQRALASLAVNGVLFLTVEVIGVQDYPAVGAVKSGGHYKAVVEGKTAEVVEFDVTTPGFLDDEMINMDAPITPAPLLTFAKPPNVGLKAQLLPPGFARRLRVQPDIRRFAQRYRQARHIAQSAPTTPQLHLKATAPSSRRFFLATPAQAVRPPADTSLLNTGAWFLGPKAENAEAFSSIVTQLLQRHYKVRERVSQQDPSFITPEVKAEPSFEASLKFLEKEVMDLSQKLELSTPFYSMRYAGHMNFDVSMASMLGYWSALLYNQVTPHPPLTCPNSPPSVYSSLVPCVSFCVE